MVASRSVAGMFGSTLVMVLVGGILASIASGGITVDLRFAGGETSQVIVGPGEVVTAQLWASVTGLNPDPLDDGLWKFYAKLLSSHGGLIQGDMSAEWEVVSIWIPIPGFWLEWAPFRDGQAASLGTQQDLDGDGDLDLGGTDPSKITDWFLARAPSLQATKDFSEWHIANVTFTGMAWGPEHVSGGISGVTEIWAESRGKDDPIWNEDLWLEDFPFTGPPPPEGTGKAGNFETGTKIVLYIASAANASANNGAEVNEGEVLLLDGTASTGSVNWWGWDFDQNGTYEVESADGTGEISFDDLFALYGDYGTYMATMAVGWAQSDRINESEAPFELTLVPEPATLGLIAVGFVLSVVGRVRRRR